MARRRLSRSRIGGTLKAPLRQTDMQDSLVEDITVLLVDRLVSGEWPAGTRIPTERALTELFGVSRATVRSGIDRLAGWKMVISRQGSGTIAQPRDRWRVGGFPYVMNHHISRNDWASLVPLLVDALSMRRALVTDYLGRAAPLTRGRILRASRAACQHAWSLRDDPRAFIAADDRYHIVILEEAGLHATLMLINEIERTYEHVIALFAATFVPPDNYLETHLSVLSALEAGDGAAAQAGIQAYFATLDPALLAALPEALATEVLNDLTRRVP